MGDLASKAYNFFSTNNAMILAVVGIFGQLIILAIQLYSTKHEGKEQRAFEIKRAILLDAVESIMGTRELLSLIATLNVGDITKKINDLKLGSCVAKLHLVSSIETIEAVSEFAKFSSKALSRMMLEKMKNEKVNFKISRVNDFIDFEIKFRDDLTSQISSGQLSPNELKAAQLKRTGAIIGLNDKFKERAELQKQYFDDQMKLTRSSIGQISTCQSIIHAVLISIRKDLKMDLDSKRYNEFMIKENAAVSVHLENFLDDLDAIIKED